MRYAVSGNIAIQEALDFDVVVIGAGLAGLYTALNIEQSRSCCILTKERLDLSSSWLAQGGIAAAMAADDAPSLHLDDTLVAGAGLCDVDAVKVLVDEGPIDINALVELNVPFDQDAMGGLRIAREGGHSRRRVLHAGGDATGKETVKALARVVAERDNVTFMERAFLVDILLDDTGTVCGALIHAEGAYRIIHTRHLVIATGGIGQVYLTTTNPEVATGDGIAAAVRAGAKLADMEFVQFHPTGLWQKGQTGQTFLISETLRGEGGILRNSKGQAFMEGQHERRDLAPRDIVARAINREMEQTGDPCAYLDMRHHPREFLLKRFPTIFENCEKIGIDMSRDLIPVIPVQHYLIGGIETDLYARTSVPGLYVCGEAASTGVHGANRLAANSMLECLVFGRRAAQAINTDVGRGDPDAPSPNHIAPCHNHITPPTYTPAIPNRKTVQIDTEALRHRVQEIMGTHGAVVREKASLQRALDEIRTIKAEIEQGFDDRRVYIELLNIVTIAEAILLAAVERQESVGAHYRKDG